jgi:hypothetical protein
VGFSPTYLAFAPETPASSKEAISFKKFTAARIVEFCSFTPPL